MSTDDPLYPACPTRLLATVKGVLKHALCADDAKDQLQANRTAGGLPAVPRRDSQSGRSRRTNRCRQRRRRLPSRPASCVGQHPTPGRWPSGRLPVGRNDRTRKSSGYSTSSARPATGSTPTSRFVAAAAAGWPKAAMPSRTRSRWPPKTVPETCGETHALQLPRRSTRSTRPAKRLRLPGTLRRPGVEPLSPGGTRHPGRGNGPRAAYGPPGRLAGIPRTPARHPRLPAGRLSPLPGLAALHAADAASPSRGRSALHRGPLRQPRGRAIQP